MSIRRGDKRPKRIFGIENTAQKSSGGVFFLSPCSPYHRSDKARKRGLDNQYYSCAGHPARFFKELFVPKIGTVLAGNKVWPARLPTDARSVGAYKQNDYLYAPNDLGRLLRERGSNKKVRVIRRRFFRAD